ncbi:MAG TPA: histidinol-phosphate transaminase [Nocardioidaceae bacterium]|nr:histidinol-phosphate transaminase [Nocardioidaceae bacterium]
MSAPRPRPALDSIPAYKAGKPPATGGGPAVSYKLSSNENPYPPLPGVLDAAARAVATLNRYPDLAANELHRAIAERVGVDVAQVATGAGSVAVLYNLLQSLCVEGDEVVYAWRSFEAYPIAVGLTGATKVAVPLDARARHDLPAMLDAITDATKAVLVCTPNNPTGPAVHADELREFVSAVPSNVVVAIDEAYREFVRDAQTVDGLEIAAGRDNVVVLRTFSKAYGLAGLRVGYAIAPSPLAEAIRKCSLPFGVSHIAQAVAVASLAAEGELLDRVEALVAERARVVEALAGAGWAVPDPQGNFVWLALGDRSEEFAAACNERGVSVRPFQGDGVRVSVGEREANDVVVEVAKAFAPA